MNKQITPILAKSVAPSGGGFTESRHRVYNATGCIYGDNCPLEAENPPFNAKTRAALQEARDIMSGKKKAKTYHSAEEFLADLKA